MIGDLPRQLMDLLRCPVCQIRVQEADLSLQCPNGHRYPIIDGIPRFSPPSTYADSFGFEWTRFPKIQLDDANSRESEEAFRVKTGLSPSHVDGKRILDAGCGMGRFTDVVARWGAAQVVAIDVSRAVDAAAQNLERHEHASVLQADLRSLPLARESFDIVFSIGVLHHTPSTRQALRYLADLLEPGGLLAVWVYSRKLSISLAGSQVLRIYTQRLKPERLLRLVSQLGPRIYSLKQRFPRWVPLIDFLVATSAHPDAEWRTLDTFDWYSPRYQWKHTYTQVERWFRELGFEQIQRGPFPISVRGRRPMSPEVGRPARRG